MSEPNELIFPFEVKTDDRIPKDCVGLENGGYIHIFRLDLIKEAAYPVAIIPAYREEIEARAAPPAPAQAREDSMLHKVRLALEYYNNKDDWGPARGVLPILDQLAALHSRQGSTAAGLMDSELWQGDPSIASVGCAFAHDAAVSIEDYLCEEHEDATVGVKEIIKKALWNFNSECLAEIKRLRQLFEERYGKRTEAARPSTQGEDADFFALVMAEVARARNKFPGTDMRLTALSEEYGEVIQAVLNHYHSQGGEDEIRKEIIQCAAMVYRLATEGDPMHKLPPLFAEARLASAQSSAHVPCEWCRNSSYFKKGSNIMHEPCMSCVGSPNWKDFAFAGKNGLARLASVDAAKDGREMREAPRVCGNCLHGKHTSLDDTRCYKDTPYLPTGRHCKACQDWERCDEIENPRAALERKEEE